MTGSLRLPALLLTLTAPVFAAPTLGFAPVVVDEVDDEFAAGVDALDRGRPDEALPHFQRVLALDPSNEAAYELWKSTDTQVWLRMLAMGGEWELIGKRLMSRAQAGRAARSRDSDAIDEKLARVLDDDPIVRKRAILELSAEHGEYAVPRMLAALADPADENRRVLFMQALTEMNEDVVLPLVEALRSDDEVLRRNVALTLGYIGDPRANGALASLASGDADGTVRSAARQSLGRTGGGEDALDELLSLGDAYMAHHYMVVNEYVWSEVVWSWQGGALVATDVPRALYAEELAKGAYYDALVADPSSTRALSGLVRTYSRQIAELDQWAARGQDVDDLMTQANEGLLATEAAGMDTLGRALAEAVATGDDLTGVGICRVLGASAGEPLPALWNALSSDDAALRAEAALALGGIAARTGNGAHPDVVSRLGEAAGREIVRIAAVIGGSASGVGDALAGNDVLVNSWGQGAVALAGLRRAPGVDLIVVAADLSDLTVDQVISDLQRDEKYAATPVLLATDDADLGDAFGDRIAGVVPTDGSDLSAAHDAFGAALDGDRAEADAIAAAAAALLADLAVAGHTDAGPALPALLSTLGGRPDAVVLPALSAIGAQGGTGQLAQVLAVASDGGRSSEARAGACDAAAAILGRDNAVGGEVLEGLSAVMRSDADLSVRQAAARALGRLDLSPEVRANVLRAVRVRIGG